MADLPDQGGLAPGRAGGAMTSSGAEPVPPPLRLYWWNGKENFGDRLSADVVAHVSGRPVAWAPADEAELFAVGSILAHARQGLKHGADRAVRPWVWGTGLMAPLKTDFLEKIRIAALRGPLTVALLDQPDLPLGDPGLLAAEALGKRPEATDRIGLVLHMSQRLSPALAERIRTDGRFRLINVRDPDHMAVVAAIGSCRHVISSSLHGLIVADSFGVPNTWLDARGIHKCAALKFHDYAISVGRVLGRPIAIEAIFDLADGLTARPAELPYAADLSRVRQDLRAAFPADLQRDAQSAARAMAGAGT